MSLLGVAPVPSYTLVGTTVAVSAPFPPAALMGFLAALGDPSTVKVLTNTLPNFDAI